MPQMQEDFDSIEGDQYTITSYAATERNGPDVGVMQVPVCLESDASGYLECPFGRCIFRAPNRAS